MTEQGNEAAKTGRAYFIGHRELGILLVYEGYKTLKVNRIPKEAIDAYARTAGVLPDSIFAKLAGVFSQISTMVDARRPVDRTKPGELDSARAIGEAAASNVLGGVQVSSADFCFVTEIPEGGFGVGRFSVEADPILNVMNMFDSPVSGNFGEIKPSNLD